MPEPILMIDVSDEEQVRDYFARLEQEAPGVIEAMNLLNISYQQYLVGLLALNQPVSSSSNTAKLNL
jgi:hypothetical protein